MNKHRAAVIAGYGIGTEVVPQELRVFAVDPGALAWRFRSVFVPVQSSAPDFGGTASISDPGRAVAGAM